jgi:predicted transcriptional regulator YdeE
VNKIDIERFKLIGISLKNKTTNKNGQSEIDCGSLWQKFEKGNYSDRISGKLNDEIFAVYHNYEGDYTQPFSYFIGCKVKTEEEVPAGLDSLIIPHGQYQKFISKGKMPDCIADSWREIWKTDIPRAYRADFEVYDEKSKDWNNAEVQIFISVE